MSDPKYGHHSLAGAAEILSPATGGFSGKAHSHGATPLPVDSRGSRFSSYDVADFPIPGGREEDWRFTPLERLHGLHEGDGPGDGKVLVDVDAAPEVVVETVDRGDERLGRAGRRRYDERYTPDAFRRRVAELL